MTAELCVISVE